MMLCYATVYSSSAVHTTPCQAQWLLFDTTAAQLPSVTTTGIAGRYGSYEEVASDPDVEIVYVGMLHPFHKASAMCALKAGKHVLVEKPFTCSYEDAKELADTAAAAGLFLLEVVCAVCRIYASDCFGVCRQAALGAYR
jgi:Oxidoreductase family, NAD-binding Rossmann fold